MEEEPLPQPKEGEHPFAPYVRILGRGRRGSRSFTESEAFEAMRMMLAGEVEPIQLGAVLMLIRVKEETPEELAGFVRAARALIAPPAGISVDIDWSSYAGKRRHPPWFILALQLLADDGIRTFIHGAEGHTPQRLYTRSVMEALGLGIAHTWDQVGSMLGNRGFCYMPLEAMLPPLAGLIELRPLLGLRSPVHSMARLLNPLDAPCVFQGIFHPPYAPLHQQAAQRLGYTRVAVIKGEGGEIERNPDAGLRVYRAGSDIPVSTEDWPAMFDRRHIRPENISAEQIHDLWTGRGEDDYAIAAVIGTAALALREHRPGLSQAEALDRAHRLWDRRNRACFEGAAGASQA